MTEQEEKFGRRKEDTMTIPGMEDLARSLTDSQKMNLKIFQNITSVNTALNRAQEDIRKIQDELAIVDRLLVTGNGVPSMQERLRNIESFVEQQKYWIRFFLGAVILQMVTFGVTVIVFVVRLAPYLDKLEVP